MIEHFEELWLQCRPAFKQERSWERGRRLALSSLACLGRHTITGMLTTSGLQFRDWSADYRFFGNERIDVKQLFSPVQQAVMSEIPKQEPLSVALDDTRLRKTGRKIFGAKWLRDPMGPHFQSNFMWGQRFLQVSALVPDEFGKPCGARAVPLSFKHCPLSIKPMKKAPIEEWVDWRKRREQEKLTVKGALELHNIRRQIDHHDNGFHRIIIASLDGGYTNETVFKHIPERTILIGRIRKDAKLFEAPPINQPTRRGRHQYYGQPMPTPEQLRQNDSIPWKQVAAFAAGKTHEFDIKEISSVRWRGAGNRDVRLVIIRPLAYRLTKNSRLLYRQPAYLLCSDSALPIDKIIQNYVWRWEIEVNFRDEKTLLGAGEAQVRTQIAVETVPTFIIASYAYLLLASRKACSGTSFNLQIPPPIWQKKAFAHRPSTAKLINVLRSNLWGKALGINKNDFMSPHLLAMKSLKIENQLSSAVLYASR